MLQELDELLKEEELKSAVFMILANKCDLREAATAEQLCGALTLPPFTNDFQLFACSVLTGQGLQQAFAWLAAAL